jgi:hypothetical protein
MRVSISFLKFPGVNWIHPRKNLEGELLSEHLVEVNLVRRNSCVDVYQYLVDIVYTQIN